MSYKIVADSAANTYELSAAPFAFVPLTIHCEGREFIDTPDLDLEEMLDLLRRTKERSSTSCPNMQDWLDAFGDAEEVYAVAITGALSGSYNAAEQAKAAYLEERPEAKVHVIDTRSAGPEMTLIVERLAALKKAGCTFEETVAGITAYCQKTKLAFCLESLQNFARNGRVSVAMAKLVGVLGVRIVGKASDEGTLQQEHLCRGAGKGLEMLMNSILQNGYAGGRMMIHHCHNEKAANALRDALLKRFSIADIRIRHNGALCSFYAEEGGLLVGYET